MTRRVAACIALVAFPLCLVQGIVAENSFTTVVWRSLQALVVTLGVGLILGVMLEKMLADGLAQNVEPENSAKLGKSD